MATVLFRSLSSPLRSKICGVVWKDAVGRGTDAPDVIESRIAKAEFELGFADKFDVIVVNDKLEVAQKEALKVIKEFLKKA